MNANLIQSQFDRLVQNPDDQKLTKQIVVEFAANLFREKPEDIRTLRVIAAEALRKVENSEHVSLKTVLATLLDIGAIAEDTVRDKIERDFVEKVVAKPLNVAVLKALFGKDLSITELVDKINSSELVQTIKTDEKQIEENLWELAQLGIIRLDMNGRFRLTLQGVCHAPS